MKEMNNHNRNIYKANSPKLKKIEQKGHCIHWLLLLKYEKPYV